MNRFPALSIVPVFLIGWILVNGIALSTSVYASSKDDPNTVKIRSYGQLGARLCRFPNCGEGRHIARIPQDTELRVKRAIDIGTGYLEEIWFEVKYQGKAGWVELDDTNKQTFDTAEDKASQIHELEMIVAPIPAFMAQENLAVYKKLAELDPDNIRYRKKCDYYLDKVYSKHPQPKARSNTSRYYVTAQSQCPAALTLSSFQKAMSASMNHQDWVVTRMLAEGKVHIVRPGTKGEIAERQRVMNGRMETIRFVFPGNPNGSYGLWTLENCFR